MGSFLWTRVQRPGPVRWEIAEDERFGRKVAGGTVFARPEQGQAVHVDVRGLRPGRWYWYRFAAGGETSPVGRTRTAPDPSADLRRLRFAFASCQHYEHGYYTAYRHLADEDLDLVVHLGDSIYEHAADGYPAPDGNVRRTFRGAGRERVRGVGVGVVGGGEMGEGCSWRLGRTFGWLWG